jgi:hypothetical protein
LFKPFIWARENLERRENHIKFVRKSHVKEERRMSMNTKIDSTSRRGFLKGMAVGAGGYALGASLIHPKEAMGQSIEGYLEKVPEAARWEYASGTYVYWKIRYLQEMYDQRGREKFLEQMKKNVLSSGPSSKKIADSLGLTGGTDPKSAAAITAAYLIIGYGRRSLKNYEIEEATAEKAKLKCLKCVFWNFVQAQNITADLCSVWCPGWTDGFAKAINPKLTSTLVKARPLGDSVCEWVIEVKA